MPSQAGNDFSIISSEIEMPKLDLFPPKTQFNSKSINSGKLVRFDNEKCL
jgi:hypothetical protein